MRWLILIASLAGCTPKVDEPACHFAGRYRLEFKAPGGKLSPFRFDVDASGTKATLIQPYSFAVDKADLELDPDRHACKLTVTARTQIGDYLASLDLDPKTQKVTGLYRTVGDRRGVNISGVRDKPGKPAASPRACIKPGVYELVVPKEQPWQQATTERSCNEATIKIPFVVDFIGDKLSVGQIAEDVDPSYVSTHVVEQGTCGANVLFQRIESSASVELTFDGDKVTAAAQQLDIYIGEPGDRWQCTAQQPVATVSRKADSVPPAKPSPSK